MKKILSLILVLIACTSLFSCGNGNAETTEAETEAATETESKEIPLNLFNYEDYVELKFYIQPGDTYRYSNSYYYEDAYVSAEATGNPHYKYNNVVFKIKVTFYDTDNYRNYLEHNINILKGEPTDGLAEAKPFIQKEYSIKLNLAGNGSLSHHNFMVPTVYNSYDKTTADNIYDRTIIEVISVSGTVEEY